MDHSLKSFDADAGTCVQTYAAPKCVMGLAVRAGGGMLAWCGGGDRMVHFWDPRVGNATGATTSLASHTVGLGFFFVSIRFVSLFSRPKRKPARMDHARERTSVTMTHTVSRRSDSMEEQISNFFPRRSLARAVRSRRVDFFFPFRFLFISPAAFAERLPFRFQRAGDGRQRRVVPRERVPARVHGVRRQRQAVGHSRETPAAHGEGAPGETAHGARAVRGLPRPEPRRVRRDRRSVAHLQGRQRRPRFMK
eukprot:30716-Pelagococcus_subviridis.AAC.5